MYNRINKSYNHNRININKLIGKTKNQNINGIKVAFDEKYQFYSTLTQNLKSEWNQEK